MRKNETFFPMLNQYNLDRGQGNKATEVKAKRATAALHQAQSVQRQELLSRASSPFGKKASIDTANLSTNKSLQDSSHRRFKRSSGASGVERTASVQPPLRSQHDSTPSAATRSKIFNKMINNKLHDRLNDYK